MHVSVAVCHGMPLPSSPILRTRQGAVNGNHERISYGRSFPERIASKLCRSRSQCRWRCRCTDADGDADAPMQMQMQMQIVLDEPTFCHKCRRADRANASNQTRAVHTYMSGPPRTKTAGTCLCAAYICMHM